MDSTVIVAAMGFVAAILAAWATSRWQREGNRQGSILEARLRAYGICSDSLYEYMRATFNRATARMNSLPETERETLRQEAYRCNARARSAIAQVAIISGDESLRQTLNAARKAIGRLNQLENRADLKLQSASVYRDLNAALDLARADLGRSR